MCELSKENLDAVLASCKQEALLQEKYEMESLNGDKMSVKSETNSIQTEKLEKCTAQLNATELNEKKATVLNWICKTEIKTKIELDENDSMKTVKMEKTTLPLNNAEMSKKNESVLNWVCKTETITKEESEMPENYCEIHQDLPPTCPDEPTTIVAPIISNETEEREVLTAVSDPIVEGTYDGCDMKELIRIRADIKEEIDIEPEELLIEIKEEVISETSEDFNSDTSEDSNSQTSEETDSVTSEETNSVASEEIPEIKKEEPDTDTFIIMPKIEPLSVDQHSVIDSLMKDLAMKTLIESVASLCMIQHYHYIAVNLYTIGGNETEIKNEKTSYFANKLKYYQIFHNNLSFLYGHINIMSSEMMLWLVSKIYDEIEVVCNAKKVQCLQRSDKFIETIITDYKRTIEEPSGVNTIFHKVKIHLQQKTTCQKLKVVQNSTLFGESPITIQRSEETISKENVKQNAIPEINNNSTVPTHPIEVIGNGTPKANRSSIPSYQNNKSNENMKVHILSPIQEICKRKPEQPKEGSELKKARATTTSAYNNLEVAKLQTYEPPVRSPPKKEDVNHSFTEHKHIIASNLRVYPISAGLFSKPPPPLPPSFFVKPPSLLPIEQPYLQNNVMPTNLQNTPFQQHNNFFEPPITRKPLHLTFGLFRNQSPPNYQKSPIIPQQQYVNNHGNIRNPNHLNHHLNMWNHDSPKPAPPPQMMYPPPQIRSPLNRNYPPHWSNYKKLPLHQNQSQNYYHSPPQQNTEHWMRLTTGPQAPIRTNLSPPQGQYRPQIKPAAYINHTKASTLNV